MASIATMDPLKGTDELVKMVVESCDTLLQNKVELSEFQSETTLGQTPLAEHVRNGESTSHGLNPGSLRPNWSRIRRSRAFTVISL